MSTPLKVNDLTVAVESDPDTPLLWVLRTDLQLNGTKYGCGIAQCGACTVLLDGQPVRSCSLPLEAVQGRMVHTIEGLYGPEIRALREAWSEVDVVQCGYCQGGQLVAAAALLQGQPTPQDADIDAAMQGILCRCGTYPRIRAAIHLAARKLAARRAGAAPAGPGAPATP